MNTTTWVILAVAMTAGVAVALVVWLVSRAVAQVPEEDRQYKDPPPLGFRLVWWPVQWVAYFIEPLIRAPRYSALLARLRKAGLDYSLSPAQFAASRWVCGLVVALLLVWVADTFAGMKQASLTAELYLQVALLGLVLGWLYPALWLRDQIALRRSEMLKTLPFFLDIVTLCVEAGLNFQGAMQQAVSKGPRGVLRNEFQRVLRDVRAGKGRAESLKAMAQRLDEPSIASFVGAVIQAENMGMSLGPVLRVQADQRRTERFLRAEKLAMEAPVKMLFPLIAFIFPCTFIVLFFPIVMKFMHSGL